MLRRVNDYGRTARPVGFGLTCILLVGALFAASYWNLRCADAALEGSAPFFLNIGWLLSFLLILGLLALLGTFIGIFESKERKADHREPEEYPKAKVAIVVVHGMGVQDRYGMLTDFGDGISTYARDYLVEETPNRGKPSNSRSFKLTSDEKEPTTTYIDLREVYWGHVFNNVTNWRSAIWFGVMTLKTFLSTLFSRFARKRLAELVWVLVATSLLVVMIFGVYGGFRLGALRLQQIYAPINKTIVADENRLDDLGMRVDGDYERYRASGIEHKLDLPDRIEEVRNFIAYSYGTLIADLGDTLAQRKPKHSLWLTPAQAQAAVQDVSWLQIFFALVHTLAFFKLWTIVLRVLGVGGKAILHDSSQLKRDRCTFNDRPSAIAKQQIGHRMSCLRAERLRLIRAAYWPGTISLVSYLFLDSYLLMLLVPFLFSMGLLAVVMRSLTWWFENFLGDVQIYVTSNENSRFFARKEEATKLVASQLGTVLAMDYDEVVVVAHSLGSAVTLNAIRQLSGYSPQSETFVRLPKLKAFITIGSPLRKFRQLFNAQRSKWSFGQHNQRGDRFVFMGNEPESTKIPWFNYWYTRDIFADQLAYTDRSGKVSITEKSKSEADKDKSGFPVGAIRDLKLGPGSFIWPHSDYWLDDKFVDTLFDIALSEDARSVNIVKEAGEIQQERTKFTPPTQAVVLMVDETKAPTSRP